MSRIRGPAAADWQGRRVREIVCTQLDIIFVGINPGRYSAARARHFAGPGNHFWRLLAESGLTPHLLSPDDDELLPSFGLGVTNIVGRPSPGGDDISRGELERGGHRLRSQAALLRPAIVCLLGRDVYRHFATLPVSAGFSWGRQALQTVPDVIDFVAPNPSPRSTVPYSKRLALFRDLARLLAHLRRWA